ncbi:peptide cleavage/export ABC transporter [Capnocytophaga canis]|uniref:peptide cleavage/export ABC transporter n=1 Tax=Capnocytophaga canis TaxID=1848903 RepID=UPI001562126E
MVKQHDIRDCGAACLSSIGSYFGIHLPIAKIRQLAHTDKRGTNLLGLIEGAEKMGLIAKGVRAPLEALSEIPTPTIAHVILEGQLQHFVVIYKVEKDTIHVMDPGEGKMKTYSVEDFAKIWSGVLVLVEKAENFVSKNEKTSNFQRFIELIAPHKVVLSQALFGAIVFTLLGLCMSIYIQKITDYVLVDGNSNLLNLLSVIMIVVILLQAYIGSKKSIFVMKTGQLIDARLILGYYKHLLRLPQRFFDTMQIGEITSRINDAVKIRAFINDVAIDMVVNIFIVIFSFSLMFIYNWKLAVIMLIIIPLYALIYFLINRYNKKVERRLMENSAELQTQLVESITHVRTIKEFSLEDFSDGKTENKFIKLLFTIYKSGLNSVFAETSTQFLASIFTVVLMWSGASFVLKGDITPGELFSFYALIGYFTSPVASLIGMNKTVQNAMIASDRLFEIMDLEREKTENKITLNRENFTDIVFENVSFRYGTRLDVFENFNAKIKANTITAIVGESGSGKTTLFALLQNLYPITEGQVTIGDYDVRNIDVQSLRSFVGIVPQQVNLFSGNIIENIALGDPFPNIQRIHDISKELGITDFVEKLPYGFETQVGENGATLSGGQKQRIAIARALYKDPQLLLLDEATSALDTASEHIVKQTIEKFKQKGRTVLVIAHRLSTIAHADTILVMEKGLLVEEGTHQELLQKQGLYHSLWNKQSIV